MIDSFDYDAYYAREAAENKAKAENDALIAGLRLRAGKAETELASLKAWAEEGLIQAEAAMGAAIAERVARGGPLHCSETDAFSVRAKTLLTSPDPAMAVAKDLADWMQNAWNMHRWVVRWRATALEQEERAKAAEAKLAELRAEERERCAKIVDDYPIDGIIVDAYDEVEDRDAKIAQRIRSGA